MKKGIPVSPFELRRKIGVVCEVGPTWAQITLPHAARREAAQELGERFGGGEVGEFVCFECGLYTVVGRITKVQLPEGNRNQLDAKMGREPDLHPYGQVHLLTSIDLATGQVTDGIAEHPRLGTNVYSAAPRLMAHVAQRFGVRDDEVPHVTLQIGRLPAGNDLEIALTPERLFGRHCAVLGTTGGGKSFTLARIIEQCSGGCAQTILIDATGEYHTLGDAAEHVFIGNAPKPRAFEVNVSVPYTHLTELDLIALFSPSGKVQGPKLREAIRSLRLARVAPHLASNGCIRKEGTLRKTFEDAIEQHACQLNSPNAEFDISKLPEQIENECIYLTDKKNPTLFGGDSGERAYCVSLIARINAMLRSSALAALFEPAGKNSVFDCIDQFLSSSEKSILRISLEHLQFDYHAREIVANALGRDLLSRARKAMFLTKPLTVFVDEAHQFLNHSLGDEETAYRLDAFELIAKEGRKYWLTICIATQRPRDIPEGVLSQMGTLIVHRLINDNDRDVVERAAGEIDRSAAAFLPTLAPGEAAIIGVDFPMPLTIQIHKPEHVPQSSGPDFQAGWRR